MKKMNFQHISVRTWVWIGLLFGGLMAVSCAPKYGCPINEETHVDFEKKKGKRGKTQLFDKKTTKRIRG